MSIDIVFKSCFYRCFNIFLRGTRFRHWSPASEKQSRISPRENSRSLVVPRAHGRNLRVTFSFVQQVPRGRPAATCAGIADATTRCFAICAGTWNGSAAGNAISRAATAAKVSPRKRACNGTWRRSIISITSSNHNIVNGIKPNLM